MGEPEREAQLVVVAAGPDSTRALHALLRTLPDGFPAPVLLAWVDDAGADDEVARGFAAAGRAPVSTVEGRRQLQPGHVYLLPRRRRIAIAEGWIEPVGPEDLGGAPTVVDRALVVAAQAAGEGTAAVILSDSAGLLPGVVAVKRAGGLVAVLQGAAHVQFIGAGVADVSAAPEQLGALVRDLLIGAGGSPPTSDDEQVRLLLADVNERVGIDFQSYKPQTIRRRLQRRVAATESKDVAQYRAYLRAHSEEFERLASSFLVKVTGFMRDPALFAYLRQSVLPEAIEHARRRGYELRLWSAGCASGEEAYSLAILVAEVLGAELEKWSVRVFATDLDNDAITVARRGVYARSSLSDLAPDLVERYFVVDGDLATVRKFVRNMTVFGVHDLAQRAPFPRTDLVLCRNVLIYFSNELQKRTLQVFAFSLRDGGALVLGTAETTTPLAEAFTVEHAALRVYRRHGDRHVVPQAHIAHLGPARMEVPRTRPPTTLAPQRATAPPVPVRRREEESIVASLPIGVVVVDAQYDIREINQVARKLLGIQGTAVGSDLLHLIDGMDVRALRIAIDAALRGEVPAALEVEAATAVSPGQRFLEISVAPRLGFGDGVERVSRPPERPPVRRAEGAVIVVRDATASVQDRQAAAHEAEARNRVVVLNRELAQANDELTATNEQLRATYDDFLVSNEEAQASTEEIETLNEELQATNEELETLNEELQATIEELNTTNEDLQARGRELLDVARAAEREQARLAAILVAMGDGVLVVDAQGRPLLTNAAYQRMFPGAIQAFVGLDGAPLGDDVHPARRAARGESFRMQFAAGRDGERRTFDAVGQGIQWQNGEGNGGVVVVREAVDRRDPPR